MKHKLYERWILDESPLSTEQQHELELHINACSNCRTLQKGWAASKLLISQSISHSPAHGFVDRWQKTAVKKRQVEKIRRYRMTLFALILMLFISSLAYMIATESFVQIFANGFSMISGLLMLITNGLSEIGYWLNRLPLAVPLTAGFAFFGLMNAFILVGIFFLWNLKQRKLQANEITVE